MGWRFEFQPTVNRVCMTQLPRVLVISVITALIVLIVNFVPPALQIEAAESWMQPRPSLTPEPRPSLTPEPDQEDRDDRAPTLTATLLPSTTSEPTVVPSSTSTQEPTNSPTPNAILLPSPTPLLPLMLPATSGRSVAPLWLVLAFGFCVGGLLIRNGLKL